jgi:hypothetical protein
MTKQRRLVLASDEAIRVDTTAITVNVGGIDTVIVAAELELAQWGQTAETQLFTPSGSFRVYWKSGRDAKQSTIDLDSATAKITVSRADYAIVAGFLMRVHRGTQMERAAVPLHLAGGAGRRPWHHRQRNGQSRKRSRGRRLHLAARLGEQRPRGILLGQKDFRLERSRTSGPSLLFERVARFELCEASEIAVIGQELAHAVLDADRRDTGIVDHVPDSFSGFEELIEDAAVARRL